MRFLPIVIGLSLLQTPAFADYLSVKPPVELKKPLPPAARIDQLLESSIRKGLVAGAVVLVGGAGGTHFAKSYGRVAAAADARQMTVDTIFDLASLTKVIATTPSILKLAEEGRLSLVDPVKKNGSRSLKVRGRTNCLSSIF